MRRVVRVLSVACVLAVLAPVLAWAQGAGAPPAATVAVDPVAVVGLPPASGSDEAKADLAIVLWLQRIRTPEQIDQARSEAKIGLATFATALGPGFDAAAHSRTRALIERLHDLTDGLIDQAKGRFARPRPLVADRRVEPVIEARSESYPSGHAMRGILYARVLAEFAPGQRDALLEVGRRIGYNRVLAGVHYPSDVLAGQRLGEAFAAALLASPAFRAEIAEIRATEWSVSR